MGCLSNQYTENVKKNLYTSNNGQSKEHIVFSVYIINVYMQTKLATICIIPIQPYTCVQIHIVNISITYC